MSYLHLPESYLIVCAMGQGQAKNIYANEDQGGKKSQCGNKSISFVFGQDKHSNSVIIINVSMFPSPPVLP